jgi:hypothetical protein
MRESYAAACATATEGSVRGTSGGCLGGASEPEVDAR